MPIDKTLLSQLRKYASAFRDARERGANESDTVMFLVKFFEDVLGYDSFKGEISKELAIKDRYCDIALKIDGDVRILVEGKAAGHSSLVDKNIEQAENYASKAGIRWVILTNGVEWKLFHLSWAEHEGISHDLAWHANLIEETDRDPQGLWDKLSLLAKLAVAKGCLDDYWEHKKSLSPSSVVKALFSQDVLMALRRELNRKAPARLDIEDVFSAVRDVLSKESLLEAGDIGITKRRKAKKRPPKVSTTEKVDSNQAGELPSECDSTDPESELSSGSDSADID